MNISATPEGGGVAELLKSIIPLENSLGLKSSWYVINSPPPEFFAITKKMHNALQSSPVFLTPEEKEIYTKVNFNIAESLRKLPKADLYVIHDPQPLAVISHVHDRPMVARIHIDLSNPEPDTLGFILPYLNQYDHAIFSMKNFITPGIKMKKTVMLPAIDPTLPKNIPMEDAVCKAVLEKFAINTNYPLISQISRFDPWKDPIGVIQAYYEAKNSVQHLQLALVGVIQAQDDPEAMEVYEHVKKHAKGDPDIFLFADSGGLSEVTNDVLVNVVQSASDVVLQKSIKEGFGLTVTEAMWKGKAVIAGNVGGITKQIRNGKDGYLVSSAEEASEKIIKIIKNENLKKRLGRSARLRVKNNFLITRLIRDQLKLYKKLLKL